MKLSFLRARARNHLMALAIALRGIVIEICHRAQSILRKMAGRGDLRLPGIIVTTQMPMPLFIAVERNQQSSAAPALSWRSFALVNIGKSRLVMRFMPEAAKIEMAESISVTFA